MYTIDFPIGDWSGDGHEVCINFTYHTNKPVQHLREVHFKTKEVFGFTVCDFANEYEDPTMPESYLDKLRDMGFSSPVNPKYVAPEEMMAMWLFMLKTVDPELEFVESLPHDTMSFYGYDEKGRHISGPGYGLFS